MQHKCNQKPQNVMPIDKAKVLMKDYLNNQDIMTLAECGINKALKIKRDIQLKVENEGKYNPSNLVHKKRVLDYLEISQDDIVKLAKIQQQLNL